MERDRPRLGGTSPPPPRPRAHPHSYATVCNKNKLLMESCVQFTNVSLKIIFVQDTYTGSELPQGERQ